MDKLYQMRKEPQRRVFGVTIVVLVVYLGVFWAPLSKGVSIVLNQWSTPIATVKNLEGVPVGKTVVIEAEYLIDSGFGYFQGDKEIVNYTLADFDMKYVFVVQLTDTSNSVFYVEDDGPHKLVIRRTSNSIFEEGRMLIIQDYADYFGLDYEEAEEDFTHATFELIGVTSSVNLMPFIGLGLIVLVGGVLYVVLNGRRERDIQKALGYDEAQQLVEDLKHVIVDGQGLILTENYLIKKNAMNVNDQFIKLSDIGWAHAWTVRKGGYGNQRYSLVFIMNGSNKQNKIVSSKYDIEQTLQWLYESDYDLVVGYQDKWFRYWQETQNGAEFRKVVMPESDEPTDKGDTGNNEEE